LDPDSVLAETQCRDWGSTPSGVCGTSYSATNVSGVGTVYSANSDPAAGVYVGCYYATARGYNNDGGWHVHDSQRFPNTGCVSTTSYGDIFLYQTEMGDYYSGSGTYQCSFTVDCYGTTRHKFDDPGARDFYSSNDGGHSTAACWDSNPPGC
jgi:hypothetical protein